MNCSWLRLTAERQGVRMEEDMLENINNTFEASVGSVYRVATFDKILLQTTIGLLETLNKRLADQGLDNPRLTAGKALAQLRAIREHGSLQPRYKEMFNQCIVLLVSHFEAALADAFRVGVSEVLDRSTDIPVLNEDIKIRIDELRDFQLDQVQSLGDMIIRKKDPSFQDMRSIRRAFEKYAEIEMPRNTDMDNIIVAQNARHVIVHAGGTANEKFMSRTTEARNGTTLELAPVEGEKIQFSPRDVGTVGESMKSFLAELCRRLTSKLRDLGAT